MHDTLGPELVYKQFPDLYRPVFAAVLVLGDHLMHESGLEIPSAA
jgi:hypothetical protein